MNSSEDPLAAPEAQAYYWGDTGQLPPEERRVLVQLLNGPFLDPQRHPRLWPVLLRSEESLRSRLSDLFLELVLDREQQVAFIRQAEVGELESPTLLRRSPLTFLDSVLLLHLRQRLTQADAQSQRAVVDIPEMEEHLRLYERSANTDRAGFNKRVHASIEKFKKNNILQKLRGSEDRFEISPTLKLLFSADEIQDLTRLYAAMAEGLVLPQTPVEEEDEEL